MKTVLMINLFVAMSCFPRLEAGELPSPQEIWHSYDPDKGDFKEEIVRVQIRDGILYRDSYISAYVLNEEIRVYCRYAVKEGAVSAPGLLNVHGWMGAPDPARKFVEDGWAVMAHDYCGKTANREHYTKYPQSLWHGNMDRKIGGPVWSEKEPGDYITDPTQTSDYIWYAVQRRVLSYLEQKKEVDKNRLAATGYSYGGTIIWNLGMDPRVKAIVAYFGIGWNEYYRSRRVWMFNVPYVEPPKTPGEEIYLAAIAPEAHVPYITAATLWLNGSNDHHGGFERGLESFKLFQPGVPNSFAVQARGHHNTDKIEQNTKFWLEKHVLGNEVFWPEKPESEIRLDDGGIPELVVIPGEPQRIKNVEIYYSLKDPSSVNRFWRDTPSMRSGDMWVGKMPVMDTGDYVFGYANVVYDTSLVLSTSFSAAIPMKLGAAKATETRSDLIIAGNDVTSGWVDVAAVEGPRGIKGFRPTSNKTGSSTGIFSDPKWQAPPDRLLSFKFYCTEPQTIILTANDYNSVELDIGASDDWQVMAVNVDKLINRFNKQPTLKDWSKVGKLSLTPMSGSDITKVVFAEFKWVETAIE
jgi:dienelactone hydrolase